MNTGADVASFEVLHDWYASLVEFRTAASNALASLGQALQHAEAWLDEQQHYWHRQIRVCEEDVSEAKAELAGRGRCPTCPANARIAACRS